MGIGTTELLIVVAVVVLLFGGRKIPELMRGVGKGLGEFKKGVEESKSTRSSLLDDNEPTAEPTAKA